MWMQWRKTALAQSYRSVFIFTHFNGDSLGKKLAPNAWKKWTTTVKKRNSFFFIFKKENDGNFYVFLLKDKTDPHLWSEQSEEKTPNAQERCVWQVQTVFPSLFFLFFILSLILNARR